MPKKTERGGPFGIFQHPSVAKHQKKYRGTLWGKKFPKKNVSQCRKKIKGGTFWSRPVSYVTRKNR